MTDPDREEVLALARICSCIALRDETRLRPQFEDALKKGVSLGCVREAVLQTYLFAGYAAAINAFVLLNEVADAMNLTPAEFWREEKAAFGVWQKRGEEYCRKIYGSQYEKLFHNMKQLHPDLADWMVWEGYGKVLARPFLSPVVRELLIVAMTAVLQVERQFYSHVRGALNVGVSSQQILSVFEQTKPFVAEDTHQRYRLILNGLLRA